MALPRQYRALEEHLPKEPLLAKSQEYSWIYSRMVKEYVEKLVGITQVPEASLVKYRTELNTLFDSLIGLNEQLTKRSVGDNNWDDGENDL